MRTLWEQAKHRMKGKLSSKSFSLWIHPLTFLLQRDHTLELSCPNKFSLNWIAENYLGLMEETLLELGAGDFRIALKVKPPEPKQRPPEIFEPSRQLTLPNVKTRGLMHWRNLNREFTFDRFVVGKCNEFAYSASKAAAFNPRWSYSSLLMLANTGLGKSHLSQAIGHAILSRDPKLKVFYITAEDFVNEMIYGLKNARIEEFKEKYRRACDVLLLEEVHFLGGKEKTQLELGHTLDALANDNKKIIFTSSMLPKDIPSLTEELSSRLTSGIITTLESPDYQTRVKILQKKAREQGLTLSEEILHLLAKHLTRDVRQMESALRCLKAKSELLEAKIDPDLAREVLNCHVGAQQCLSLKSIEELVCRYFKIDPAVLESKSRKKVHTYPRNVYVYLCRHHTNETLEKIGRSIGRTHSTALYASEVIERRMRTDRQVKKQVDFLTQRLQETSQGRSVAGPP